MFRAFEAALAAFVSGFATGAIVGMGATFAADRWPVCRAILDEPDDPRTDGMVCERPRLHFGRHHGGSLWWPRRRGERRAVLS